MSRLPPAAPAPAKHPSDVRFDDNLHQHHHRLESALNDHDHDDLHHNHGDHDGRSHCGSVGDEDRFRGSGIESNQLSYTIFVRNNGPAQADNVVMTDVLPQA